MKCLLCCLLRSYLKFSQRNIPVFVLHVPHLKPIKHFDAQMEGHLLTSTTLPQVPGIRWDFSWVAFKSKLALIHWVARFKLDNLREVSDTQQNLINTYFLKEVIQFEWS